MAILGRELVIARRSAPDTFTPLCITEQRSIEINNEEIDITKPNCLAPGTKLQRLLMYGLQAINVAGQGAFVDTPSMQSAVASAVGQVIDTYQITVPTVGTFEGEGLISLTLSGDKTGELQSDIKLSLQGNVAFVPEP